MQYAITVRIVRPGNPNEISYLQWLSNLSRQTRIEKLIFEHTAGLHMHLLVQSSDEELYKKRRGVHVLVEPIFNVSGWIKYLLKTFPDTIEKLEYIEHYDAMERAKRIRLV